MRWRYECIIHVYNKCLTQLASLCDLAPVDLSSLVSLLLPQPLSLLSCSFTKILALGLKPTLFFQVSRPLYKGFPLPGIPCSLLGHSAGLVFLPLRSLLSISSTPNSDLREAWVVLGKSHLFSWNGPIYHCSIHCSTPSL